MPPPQNSRLELLLSRHLMREHFSSHVGDSAGSEDVTGISEIVSHGYGPWGSVPGIVTLGYTAGEALPDVLPIGWSGRPGANQRRKHRSIQLPPGIAAANDLAETNKKWDELVAQHKKRMAVEASRKVLASAKRAEKAAQLPRTTEPKQKAPKFSDAPQKRAVAAAPLGQQNPTLAAAAQEALRTRTVPPVPPKHPAAPAQDRPLPALDLSALGQALTPELVGFVDVIYRAVVQGVRNEMRAEEQQRKEVSAKANKIRVERQQWERRISSLLAQASAVHQRPVPGRTAVRPPSRMAVH
jgi:hypothetical protein